MGESVETLLQLEYEGLAYDAVQLHPKEQTNLALGLSRHTFSLYEEKVPRPSG